MISDEPAPKGKKRPLQEDAEDADEAPKLVDTSKLSKSQKKKLKKQKREEESDKTNGSAEKKVQFASKLEQGPTATQKSPSAEPPKPVLTTATSEKGKKEKMTLASGVVVEEHTVGKGKKAANGAKLGIRYIGKLAKNGKEFDKNTKGKPFRFTLGKSEVIKGISLQ
jgi:FK506-binding nuclear protein